VNVTIRFGRLSDQAELEAIQWRASFVWKEYRASLRAHPDAVEVPAAQLRARGVRVAEIDRRRVGFAALVLTRPGIVELDGLFVEPDVMGVGIGRRLMEDVIRLARRRGARVMMVTAGPARGFYEKIGFRFVRATPTRFGAAVRMRRQIT
jgi:GNAT superfamily N-acetyltransferase